MKFKNTLLASLFTACLFLIAASAFHGPRSTGAPPSSTGAPGEHTCAKSGCHDDSAVNDGVALIDLNIGDNTAYIPGQTYTVTASITEGQLQRFGFELVAVSEHDESNAGSFLITDSGRTHVVKNFLELTDREYVTYTYAGSGAIAAGLGEWSFEWKAPGTDVGPVNFYLAAVAANDDGSDDGDKVYTEQVSLSAAVANPVNDLKKPVSSFAATQSPGGILLQYDLHGPADVTIELIGLNGQIVAVWEAGLKSSGMHTTYKSIDVPAGLYIIGFSADAERVTKKVIAQ